MLVYYGNIQCISARELIDKGYITKSCYDNWVNRGRIKVVRRGGGAAGNCALVALNSLPTECLERVKEDNPGGTEQALRHWIDNRKIRQPEQTEGNSHGRTPGDEFESTSQPTIRQ